MARTGGFKASLWRIHRAPWGAPWTLRGPSMVGPRSAMEGSWSAVEDACSAIAGPCRVYGVSMEHHEGRHGEFIIAPWRVYGGSMAGPWFAMEVAMACPCSAKGLWRVHCRSMDRHVDRHGGFMERHGVSTEDSCRVHGASIEGPSPVHEGSVALHGGFIECPWTFPWRIDGGSMARRRRIHGTEWRVHAVSVERYAGSVDSPLRVDRDYMITFWRGMRAPWRVYGGFMEGLLRVQGAPRRVH